MCNELENRIFTPGQQDLDDIYEYFAAGGDEDSAASFTVRLVNTADSLNELPLRHRVYDVEPWRAMGVRFLTVERYLIFCRLLENSRTVQIIRILHGSRDIINTLRKR